MGQFRDILPSQLGWIHELARAENNPHLEKLLNSDASFDPQQLMEESAIEFLTELRGKFNELAKIFNSYSENSTKFQEIRVYSLANTAADFMIFRNQVKLIFANSAHGVIQISFAQHTRNTLAVNGQSQPVPVENASGSMPLTSAKSQDIMAQTGPFRDVFWTFQGEKVTAEQVAKFYFAEFVRMTRDTNRSKIGNKVLLEQIKALLQEKGLDL